MHGTTPRQWVASWHDSGHLHGSPRRPSANYREHLHRRCPSHRCNMPTSPLLARPRMTPACKALQGQFWKRRPWLESSSTVPPVLFASLTSLLRYPTTPILPSWTVGAQYRSVTLSVRPRRHRVAGCARLCSGMRRCRPSGCMPLQARRCHDIIWGCGRPPAAIMIARVHDGTGSKCTAAHAHYRIIAPPFSTNTIGASTVLGRGLVPGVTTPCVSTGQV